MLLGLPSATIGVIWCGEPACCPDIRMKVIAGIQEGLRRPSSPCILLVSRFRKALVVRFVSVLSVALTEVVL